MAFRRFQTGTLGRSVKRFGRFPRLSGFKRKQFTGFTGVISEQALDRTVATADKVTLFSNTDFDPNLSESPVIRNVFVDAVFMWHWSPTITTLAYDSWYYHWGVWCVDADENATTVSGYFLQKKALVWDAFCRNTQEITSPAANTDIRYERRRVKFRVPKVGYDDVIQFVGAFNSTVTETIIDARLSMVANIRYEVP